MINTKSSAAAKTILLLGVLINAVSAYLGTPPPDPKITEATKRVMKTPPTVNDYKEAVLAGMHTLLSANPISDMANEAGESALFCLSSHRRGLFGCDSPQIEPYLN